MPQIHDPNQRISSGIEGLDAILLGGFPAGHVYLIEGHPGAGKTTLALHFLLEGVKQGESVLYVTLSETRAELEAVAASHGWSLEGISIFELTAEDTLMPDEQYTVFHPSEVELSNTSKALFEQFDSVRPSRVVLDSLSELRLLAREPLRYRRQILALKQYFVGRKTTVLLLDDRTAEDQYEQLQSISHGVLALEQVRPEYGGERRRLSVDKLRGSRFKGGYHDYTIVSGGLRVFPRLVAANYPAEGATQEQVTTGVKGLDDLLGGGVDGGASTLVMGPAGSGKSTIALEVASAAAERGEKSLILVFDEAISTAIRRARGLGIPLEAHMASGLIQMVSIDPAELSPGEFVSHICDSVDAGVKVVVIDSVNGFMQAMPGEKFVLIQLHELLTYLGHKGVITMLVLAQNGLVGGRIDAPLEISYLADTVILLRYFEAFGKVRRAISAVKRRVGVHDEGIRELNIIPGSVTVGKTLEEFQGILTGDITYVGRIDALAQGD